MIHPNTTGPSVEIDVHAWEGGLRRRSPALSGLKTRSIYQ